MKKTPEIAEVKTDPLVVGTSLSPPAEAEASPTVVRTFLFSPADVKTGSLVVRILVSSSVLTGYPSSYAMKNVNLAKKSTVQQREL